MRIAGEVRININYSDMTLEKFLKRAEVKNVEESCILKSGLLVPDLGQITENVVVYAFHQHESIKDITRRLGQRLRLPVTIEYVLAPELLSAFPGCALTALSSPWKHPENGITICPTIVRDQDGTMLRNVAIWEDATGYQDFLFPTIKVV